MVIVVESGDGSVEDRVEEAIGHVDGIVTPPVFEPRPGSRQPCVKRLFVA